MPRKYRGTAIPTKEKDKQAMTSDAAYRVNLKGGGCAQIKGFGKARKPKK